MGLNEKLIWTESMKTASTLADYSSKQYYGAKLSADRTVNLPTADTDVPVGLVLNKPNVSKDALLLIVGRAPAVVAEAITAGQLVRIASGGKVALFEPTTDRTAYCVGQCVEGADTDEMGVFNFNFATPVKGDLIE